MNFWIIINMHEVLNIEEEIKLISTNIVFYINLSRNNIF